MATWLVTGGCGFIGSHVVEALIGRGERVRVLDNLSSGSRDNISRHVDLRVADVADEKAVAEAIEGVAGCFHLAAVASVPRCNQDWIGSHRTNLTGTITIFEKARGQGRSPPVPVVYASSAAVYGDNQQLPLGEAAETSPISAYGADKLACELHGKIAWSVHHVPNVGLRLFNVYGPRQDPASPYSGVISIFSDRIVNGCDLEIFGDGTQTRDFVYVADVVFHLFAAMESLHSGAHVFNVCTGRATTVLELATMIASIGGEQPPIRYRSPRIGDIQSSIGDPSAAIKALGVSARTSMEDGLRKTLDWRLTLGRSSRTGDRAIATEQTVF